MAKTIIVTGAYGNLGKAVVKKMLGLDYIVEATIGLKEDPGLYPADNLYTQKLDLNDPEAVKQYVGNIALKYDEIEAAVLLVGGFAMGSIKETTNDDLLKMYRLNFETAYNIVRPLLNIFEKQQNGGQIVFIGSRSPLNPAEGKSSVAYALSKSLIFKLSELINAEYKNKNITSYVIAPATMDTPVNRIAMPDADFARWVPTGKVADVIAFLLSGTGKMIKESVIKIYNRT
jgi:NAD(P)-dependent dehydrogenase (short-subunit alcohol dehydrogenase family)